ncbi:MAG TPA: hypothetical protein VFZ37_08895 [Jiangellaceae bacterium]
MPAEFDDLSRRLSDLESDVAQLHMAGPAAARRRGRQRSRNRAAAVVLGSAAAIAIGIGTLDAIPQATPTPPEPIDTPTPDPTPAPAPNPSPTSEAPEPDPLANLLLEPGDLADLGSPWVDLSWSEGTREPELGCFPAGPDGVQTAGVTFESARTIDQPGDFPVWADERIYTFANESDADAALSALRSEVVQCATERNGDDFTWGYDGIGDVAFESEMWPPAEQPLGRVTPFIGAARTGSTLVVTVTYLYMEGELIDHAELLAAAVARACGGDCVGEITQQIYPDAGAQAGDPQLPDEDVNPIGSYTDFVRSDTLSGSNRYEYFCLPELVYPDAAGQPSSEPVQVGGEAPTIYQGEWYGPSEGGFHETVIQFPDDQQAAGFVADHTELPEQCGDVVETHEQVVNQPASVDVSGADEALVWTIDERVLPGDPGSEPSFHGVGMARAGNVVVVIGFHAFGDPTTGTSGTWADYAIDTLAVAIDRAQR